MQKGKQGHRLLCLLFIMTVLLGFSGRLVVAADKTGAYLEEAHRYLQQGKVNEAIIQLKNALQQNPKDPQARFLLGQAYIQGGDGAAAEKELQQAKELGLARQDWLAPLGQSYLLQGKFERLLQDINLDPGDPPGLRSDILSLRGSAELALNRSDQAKSDFAQALSLNPENIKALLGQANLAVQAKDLAQAMTLVDKSLAIKADNVEALIMKGELQRQQKSYSESIAAFERVLELQPNNLLARIGRIQSWLAQNEVDKALADVQALKKSYPNAPIVNYLYGFVQLQKNNLPAAQDALQQVMKVAPDHVPSQFLLGMLNYQQGNSQQAEDYLSRVIRQQPANLQARKLLAAAEMKLNNPQRAIELLTAGVNQAPQDAGLLALLGSAYIQNRDFDKGTEYLQKAADLAPNVSAIRTQLALSHLAGGELQQAETQLEKAVDLGQGLLQADVLLIYTQLRQQQFDKAIESAEKLTEKRKDDPLAYNLLGGAYMAKGDDPRARQAFEQALKLKIDYVNAQINLGRLDLKAGNRESARRRYQDLLVKNPGDPAVLQELINLATQEGRPEEILPLLEKAWERNPKAPGIGLALAEQYLRRGDSLKALNVLRPLDSANPNNPLILRILGQTLLAAGATDDALGDFRKLTELQPQSPEPWLWLAQAQMQLKNTKAAAEAIDKSLAIKKDYLPALEARTRLLLADNRPEEALKCAQAIQQQALANSLGYQLEGLIYNQQENYAKAAAAFQTAYSKAPSSALALNLAGAQWESHNQEAALKTLRQWLANNPEDAGIRTQLAIYLEQLNRPEQAIVEYEQVLKQAPEDIIVLNNLAGLYGNRADPRGIQYAEQALALAQKKPGLAARLPEIKDTLGWALVQNNQVQRGLDILKEAAVQAAQVPEIGYHLAAAYHKAGQPEEARQALEKLLETSKNFPSAKEAQALLKSLRQQP